MKSNDMFYEKKMSIQLFVKYSIIPSIQTIVLTFQEIIV